jgi:hypothetical protein
MPTKKSQNRRRLHFGRLDRARAVDPARRYPQRQSRCEPSNSGRSKPLRNFGSHNGNQLGTSTCRGTGSGVCMYEEFLESCLTCPVRCSQLACHRKANPSRTYNIAKNDLERHPRLGQSSHRAFREVRARGSPAVQRRRRRAKVGRSKRLAIFGGKLEISLGRPP